MTRDLCVVCFLFKKKSICLLLFLSHCIRCWGMEIVREPSLTDRPQPTIIASVLLSAINQHLIRRQWPFQRLSSPGLAGGKKCKKHSHQVSQAFLHEAERRRTFHDLGCKSQHHLNSDMSIPAHSNSRFPLRDQIAHGRAL